MGDEAPQPGRGAAVHGAEREAGERCRRLGPPPAPRPLRQDAGHPLPHRPGQRRASTTWALLNWPWGTYLLADRSAWQEAAMAELDGAGSDLDRWLEPFLKGGGHQKRRARGRVRLPGQA